MNRLYIVALLVLALASGCQQEEMSSPDSNASLLEVYATTEDLPDTRTYMSGTEVYWSSGDKIAVFYKNTLRKRFDVTPESVSSKNATFLQDPDYVMAGTNVAISNNVAYYPFGNVTCAVEGTSYVIGNVTLPSTQNYVPESAGLGAYPMVAVTENTDDLNFAFKNVCGAMMFQLKGYGFIRSVSVKGNSDEVLSGSATVNASYGKYPSIAMSADGDKVVTLDCGEQGVELDEDTPTSFIIALPPVPFASGFTITVTDTWGGTKEYSTSKANAIQRSKILRMPAQKYFGVRSPQEGDYIDEYGVNHGQGIEIDGVVWAPVNCGYHATDYKYGKLYQWGRKYGQGYSGDLYDVYGREVEPYSDAIVPIVEMGPISLIDGQSEENKNKFYTYGSSSYDDPHDWVDTQDGKLWNSGTEESPVKTEYDPCPAGWRVPTYAELCELCQNKSSMTTNDEGKNGYWLSGANAYTKETPQVFFPASGYRSGFGGSAKERGCSASYWSSKPEYDPFRDDSYRLIFDHIWLAINEYHRAFGFSVRCVLE